MEELERVIRTLVENYLVKRDYAGLSDILAEDFSFFGTGANEIGYYEDIEAYFAQEMAAYDGSFTVSGMWVHASMATADVALAMVGMTVASDPGTGYDMTKPLRFTVVMRREGEVWKLVHVHNSVPYEDQTEGSFFDHDAVKSLARAEIDRAMQMDTLTGILNQEGFVARARELIDANPDTRYAVMKFGISHFRYINQRFGFDVGDTVLKDIAANLAADCAEDEASGRIEKDLFTILMKMDGELELGRRIRRLFAELLSGKQRERVRQLSFTGGVYVLKPGSREDVKNMLDKALLAQQSASKNQTPNSFSFYTPQMDAQLLRRTQMSEQAAAAMENGEYKLYIQPQVDIRTGRPVAGEALVRWVQQDGKLVMPGEFIPVFEQNGFIAPFDFHMLDVLCRQMRAWIDKGIALAPISINQSRLHLRNKKYIDQFCAVVDKYGIPHKYLSFELTEYAFVEYSDMVLAMAKEIHERGFLLDIDDFGTGYASLNMLSQMDADVLKIDRSLLVDLDVNPKGRTILRTVVEMAREIRMVTICEGVETEAQLEFLREIGCDMGQGFYFYRPMSAERFEAEILRKQFAHA